MAMKGYGEGIPLGGYATLLATWPVAVGGAALVAARRGRLPRRWSLGDLVLAGVATHKLTRVLTRDWVTAPIRAPFTHYEGPSIAGEVRERSRGRGLRRAVGDLLTCEYCTGPWVAGALLCSAAFAPRATRLLVGIFTAVTVSDFLHRAYEALAAKAEHASAGEE